jgi:hypothetical protein
MEQLYPKVDEIEGVVFSPQILLSTKEYHPNPNNYI